MLCPRDGSVALKGSRAISLGSISRGFCLLPLWRRIGSSFKRYVREAERRKNVAWLVLTPETEPFFISCGYVLFFLVEVLGPNDRYVLIGCMGTTSRLYWGYQ